MEIVWSCGAEQRRGSWSRGWAIAQPCFCRGNAVEVPEGRSQHLRQCWMLCWYRTHLPMLCLAHLRSCILRVGSVFAGGGEAEQEAGIYPRLCRADSLFCLCWASDECCGPGSQFLGQCQHQRCWWGAEDRVSAAPSSLNHLLSPLVAGTCSCLSCVYPSPIPFLPFPQAD